METVIHFIKAGGFVMYPLLLFSLSAVVVIVERFLAFRQFGTTPRRLLADVMRYMQEGRSEAAAQYCSGRTGPVAACLRVVLENRNLPVREVERLVEETGQEYFIRLERFLPFLDTTTTVSPLLGLLGTIVGMIGTFNAIASAQHRGAGDQILSGVGEALYATATGLVVAVVCFIAYNYFTSRLRSVTTETEQAVTRLLNVLTTMHHQECLERNHEMTGAAGPPEEVRGGV